jgi:hypothetical protein
MPKSSPELELNARISSSDAACFDQCVNPSEPFAMRSTTHTPLDFDDGSIHYFTVLETKGLQTFLDDLVHGAWGEAIRQLDNAVEGSDWEATLEGFKGG